MFPLTFTLIPFFFQREGSLRPLGPLGFLSPWIDARDVLFGKGASHRAVPWLYTLGKRLHYIVYSSTNCCPRVSEYCLSQNSYVLEGKNEHLAVWADLSLAIHAILVRLADRSTTGPAHQTFPLQI